MSGFDPCDICRCEGAGGGGSCQSPHHHYHRADLNRAIPVFPEPHEFQFFGHDDTVAWLLNDPRSAEPPPPPQPPPPPPPPHTDYMESFRETPFLPGHGLTFDVPLSRAGLQSLTESGPGTPDEFGAGHAAASSATIVSDVVLREHVHGRFEQERKGRGGSHDGEPRGPDDGERGEGDEVQGEAEEAELREADPVCLEKGLCRNEAEDQRSVREGRGDDPTDARAATSSASCSSCCSSSFLRP